MDNALFNLLNKYPTLITNITVNNSGINLLVVNVSEFNILLEKTTINFIEFGSDDTISYHKFGVVVANHEWPSARANVFIPKDSITSVIKNLLL